MVAEPRHHLQKFGLKQDVGRNGKNPLLRPKNFPDSEPIPSHVSRYISNNNDDVLVRVQGCRSVQKIEENPLAQTLSRI